MAKIVIDLTSSPEPDERPNLPRTNVTSTTYEKPFSPPYNDGLIGKRYDKKRQNGWKNRHDVLSSGNHGHTTKLESTKLSHQQKAIPSSTQATPNYHYDESLAGVLRILHGGHEPPKLGDRTHPVTTSATNIIVNFETTAKKIPFSRYDHHDSSLRVKRTPILSGGGIEIVDLHPDEHDVHCVQLGESTPSSSDNEQKEPPSKRQRVMKTQLAPQLLFGDKTAKSIVPPEPSGTMHTGAAVPQVEQMAISSQAGEPYTAKEDSLLVELKDAHNLRWDQICQYFPGRSLGSLQVRYGKASKRAIASISNNKEIKDKAHAPKRQRRNEGLSAVNGFISWESIDRLRSNDMIDEITEMPDQQSPADRSLQLDRTFPNSVQRILRQRELGGTGHKAWNRSTTLVSTELKTHAYEKYQLRRTFADGPADIGCIAWSPDVRHSGGKLRFAAGSICVSDERNMQYNKPYNLLLGDYETNILYELPDHHVKRPVIDKKTCDNPNTLESMRNTQDDRLFLTVDALQFSPCGSRLHSAGYDGMLRSYNLDIDHESSVCDFQAEHPAPVTHLSVNSSGHIATACRQQDHSVKVFGSTTPDPVTITFSPTSKPYGQASITPSALAWDTRYGYHKYLLAGYASFGYEEDHVASGDVCLWDVESGHRIELTGTGRSVFDISWNSLPGMSSPPFAIATPAQTPGKKTRSVVQCFAPSNGRWRSVIELDCPALDINHLTFCPHDDRLIAAGATDGCVYVWDLRFVNSKQSPLHQLRHQGSLNTSMLDHSRDRETFDTGVRFLSWGATSSRLFSGSSDGVVKSWNQYRSEGNAHVEDVAKLGTAIMSGAFSPDFCDLLIGEECGRLSLLSICSGELDEYSGTSRTQPFELRSASAGETQTTYEAARNLVNSKQIVYRPMGDLPIRQAVQGPNYDGPFLKPSSSEWKNARIAQQSAQNRSDLLRDAKQGCDDMNFEEPIEVTKEKAQRNLVSATEALQKLSIRESEYERLAPQAAAHQAALRKREPTDPDAIKRSHDHVRSLAAISVPHESRVSGGRVPGALLAWRGEQIILRDLDCDGMYAHGLAPKCPNCISMKGTSSRVKLARKIGCQRHLVLIKSSLSNTCQSCARPMAVDPSSSISGTRSSSTRSVSGLRKLDSNDSNVASDARLCSRCRFDCLRCGREACLSRDGTRVDCARCDLCWEVGVLGYELVGHGLQRQQRTNHDERTAKTKPKFDEPRANKVREHSKSTVVSDSNPSDGDEDDWGWDEIKHYHSRWSRHTAHHRDE